MATKKNSQKTQQKVARTKSVMSQTNAIKEKVSRQMRVTIYFGYGLFIFTVIALVVSIIPWFSIYSFPFFTETDVTLLLVSFAFAALAPPLVGYLAGDGATSSSSKLVHHYNGVLFGILGIWLWLTASMASTVIQWIFSAQDNLQHAVYSIAPAAFAALVTIILAIFYARSTRHQVSLIDYRPYRWTLILSAVALILVTGSTTFFSLWYGGGVWMSALITLVVPLTLLLVSTLLGYWIVGEKSGTVGERIVYSLVAVGYGIVTMTLIGQFTVYLFSWQANMMWYAVGITILLSVSYLYLLRRASR